MRRTTCIAALMAALAIAGPAAARPLGLSYNQAKHAAAVAGKRLVHRPVKVKALDHMWGNKWYAQLEYNCGSTYPGLIDMYVNKVHGRITTRILSNDCF